MTWETCSLRQWLNNSFLNAAFTPEEQEKNAVTTVKAPQRLYMQGCTREDFPWLSDEEVTKMLIEGNDTENKVYLFSLDELLHYFPEKESRTCLARSMPSHGVLSRANMIVRWLQATGQGATRGVMIRL